MVVESNLLSAQVATAARKQELIAVAKCSFTCGHTIGARNWGFFRHFA